MLDSGSPISLIKNCCVPSYVTNSIAGDKVEFHGINGSRLNILKIFYRDVMIEEINLKIKFHVVPDDTMAFIIILGRDFSSNPAIKIEVSDKIKVLSKNNNIENIKHCNY